MQAIPQWIIETHQIKFRSEMVWAVRYPHNFQGEMITRICTKRTCKELSINTAKQLLRGREGWDWGFKGVSMIAYNLRLILCLVEKMRHRCPTRGNREREGEKGEGGSGAGTSSWGGSGGASLARFGWGARWCALLGTFFHVKNDSVPSLGVAKG